MQLHPTLRRKKQIAVLEKEGIMLRTHDRQSSVPAQSFRCAAASPHARSTFRIFATCLMFLLLAHVPASASVHHLYYNNSQWVDQDLGGTPFSNSAIAAFYTPGKQLHVYYIDTNRHVRQLYYNNKSWSDEDLTAATDGPNAGIWGITGFAVGNLQHVFYIRYSDSHVHELYYNNASWSDQDITASAVGGGPANLVAPQLVGFSTPGPQFHVYYEDSNLDMHQLYFNSNSWTDQDLTVLTGASCYPGTPFPPAGAGYIAGFAVGNQQHLFCPGLDASKQYEHMIHIYYNNSVWTSEDITALVGGGTIASNGAVAGFRYPGKTQLEVYGVTFEGHVHQFTFKGKKWTDVDLTASIGAPSDYWYGGAIAFPTTPNNQFHFYYQPSPEVYQLYFNGTSWLVNDLTRGGGQADYYGSGMAGFAIGNLQHVFYVASGS
jgi:fucose-binding lectin